MVATPCDWPQTAFPAEQFVQVTPGSVLFGWRDLDGEVGQVTSFDLDPIRRPGRACNWRSSFGSMLT